MIPKGPDDGPEVVRTELAGTPGPMGKLGKSRGGHSNEGNAPEGGVGLVPLAEGDGDKSLRVLLVLG